MRYDFTDEFGRRVEISYPMGRAPAIGSWIRRGGRRLKRIPSLPARSVAASNPHFVCYSQHPDAVASGDRVVVGGIEFAAISSRRQIAETVARSEGRIVYGDGIHAVRGGARWQ